MKTASIFAVCVGLLASWSIEGAERNAYLYRTDGKFVRVSLPASAPSEVQYIEPVVVADLWASDIDAQSGSTWWPDGRVLILSRYRGSENPSRLFSLDAITGDTEMLTTISINAVPNSDLTLSPDGRLMFMEYGSSSGSSFYVLDPVTGAVEEQGMVSPPCTTVELHQGKYYAACWDAFFSRIDPGTYESTQIAWTSPFDRTHITGLSSAGGDLWYLTEDYYWPSQGNLAEIGTIDPETGDRTPFCRIRAGWPDAFSFLEIAEQVTSEPIPVIRPTGMVVLLMLIAAAALLTLRNT